MRNLRCEGVEKWFGGFHALRGVTLSFPSGSTVGIVGPNGAGKTTLFDVLSGFVRPERGRSFYGSREVTGLLPYQLCRLGICRTFQGMRVIGSETVLENLLLAMPGQKGESLVRALTGSGMALERRSFETEGRKLLELGGLSRKATELAAELSYGEQKLLGLLSCIASGADVILLDEPFAGLQPLIVKRVTELINTLRKAGKAVAVIEHDFVIIKNISDIVVVMDRGSIVAEGPPDEVLSGSKFMEVFIA